VGFVGQSAIIGIAGWGRVAVDFREIIFSSSDQRTCPGAEDDLEVEESQGCIA